MTFGKQRQGKTTEAGDEYSGLSGVSVTERTPEPPRGSHVMRWDEFFEHQGNKGTFGIFRFTCLESDMPTNEGRAFGLARDKYPKKGGITQYFKTIKPIVTAMLGYVPGSDEAAELEPHWGKIFKEILTDQSIDGKPLASYKARVTVTPDKNPAYSRFSWEPAE